MLSGDDAQRLDELTARLRHHLDSSGSAEDPTPTSGEPQEVEVHNSNKVQNPAHSDIRKCECNGRIIFTNIACPCQ
jgi:hypothetical protein